MNNQPKIDKKFLQTLSCAAKAQYKDNGNKVGIEYLDDDEIIARAWYQAVERVLVSQGYSIARKDML